jgi:hypothetical protein
MPARPSGSAVFAALSLFIGVALEVGDYKNPLLSYTFFALAALLAIYWAWPNLRRGAASIRAYRPRLPWVRADALLTSSQNDEIVAHRAQIEAKDQEIAKLREVSGRADQWLRTEADKRALDNLKAILAKQRHTAEQNHRIVMTRRNAPNMPIPDPNEGHANYGDAVTKICAAYKEYFKKEAPDLTSHEQYRDYPTVPVPGERDDLSAKEQADVRRHYWMHESFKQGMPQIDNEIRRESSRLDGVLNRLQQQVRDQDKASDRAANEPLS